MWTLIWVFICCPTTCFVTFGDQKLKKKLWATLSLHKSTWTSRNLLILVRFVFYASKTTQKKKFEPKKIGTAFFGTPPCQLWTPCGFWIGLATLRIHCARGRVITGRCALVHVITTRGHVHVSSLNGVDDVVVGVLGGRCARSKFFLFVCMPCNSCILSCGWAHLK